MKVIGITGPTGAGKTTALHALEALGAQIIDADAVYHGLLRDSAELRRALTAAFGEDILDGEGRIDRKKLAAAVYPGRLEELNAITHPFVVAAVEEELARCAEEGRNAAIDAIALVESGLGEKCDAVVAVLAPLEVRIARIMARDGIDEPYARRRALAQKGDDFFRSHADRVLENRGEESPEEFSRRAEELFRELLE